ncbi:NAD(P)/FAD-dependent oxidoreductase [Arthrobacter castelli]|uniref:NAD(P)/FAD-dependent oxidoreductase n=1 Tax=Arthrobacter castelli TaxID=271431 RepID=UPI00042975CA|nr:FAD-dependent oxidoreductase [Arthrobacter castelli]
MIPEFDYLIIGGGMAADASAKGIREVDSIGTIGIAGDDVDPPYTRPALTKKLWTDPEFTAEDNWLHTASETDAEVMTETVISAVNPHEHTATMDDGGSIRYGKLLLATGGHPKRLDVPAGPRSIYFRSFADYRALRRLSGKDRNIAVVGGSYIGTELAAALVQNGTRPSLIYPDKVLTGSMFPADLAARFERTYAEHGVELFPGTTVTSGRTTSDGVVLSLDDGSERSFDAMVSGLGISPCMEVAEQAGLQVDDGIVVDEGLRTSVPDIYAAGDVANYPDRILGRRRIEHVDNATLMGSAAGRAMAGSNEIYDHTPYYYSNVFDMAYQAVGTVDASLEMVEDWAEPQRKGVVYYLDGGNVVAGVLLWNVPDRLAEARKVLADNQPKDASALRGAIGM